MPLGWEAGLWVLLRHLVLKCLECFRWRSLKWVRNGLCVNPYIWKLFLWGLTSWGLRVIVINFLFIELLAAGNIKCLVRLEMPEEGSSGKVLHGQSIKHMNKCCLLTVPRALLVCSMGACFEILSNLPSVGPELAWFLTPWVKLLALENLRGQKCERKHKEKCDSRAREIRVSLSRRWGKESVRGMALVHSWKEMKGISYNSKMTVFNKYFALYLQKGRGCHIAEQEVCCYNTIFW